MKEVKTPFVVADLPRPNKMKRWAVGASKFCYKEPESDEEDVFDVVGQIAARILLRKTQLWELCFPHCMEVSELLGEIHQQCKAEVLTREVIREEDE